MSGDAVDGKDRVGVVNESTLVGDSSDLGPEIWLQQQAYLLKACNGTESDAVSSALHQPTKRPPNDASESRLQLLCRCIWVLTSPSATSCLVHELLVFVES